MEWYGLAAVALIGLGFCLIHRIPTFLVWAAAVIFGFIVVTFRSVTADRVPEWAVMIAALAAWVPGFAIVRLMLSRSVSLQLLGRIGGIHAVAFHEDIRERIADMRTARLVRSTEPLALTPFGRCVAAIVTVTYRAFRLEA